MKIARFNGGRIGIVIGDTIRDVTEAAGIDPQEWPPVGPLRLIANFAALRDNPIRAESLGINLTAYTLLAFALGAACAGIAGAYFCALVQFIEPAPFNLGASLMMLLMVIVGGSGRFFGPMLGAGVVVLLPEWLRFLEDWYLAIFGFSVVAMMIWLPGGLLSIGERLRLRGADR